MPGGAFARGLETDAGLRVSCETSEREVDAYRLQVKRKRFWSFQSLFCPASAIRNFGLRETKR